MHITRELEWNQISTKDINKKGIKHESDQKWYLIKSMTFEVKLHFLQLECNNGSFVNKDLILIKLDF